MREDRPLVSVVIPTYHRPEQICDAIDCVLKQTYPNIEIIGVDDNGQDDIFQRETVVALRRYLDKINYIVHENNCGGSAARNTGWKASSGKYVMFLDDDDYINERKIECQVDAIESKDETWGACYTAYHVVLPTGEIQYSGTKKSGNLYLQALMRTLYICAGSNLLIRRCAIKKIGGYDESFKRNQDVEFLTRLCELYKILYVDKDYLEVRMGSVPHGKRYTLDLYEEVTDFYIEKFKGRIDALEPKDRRKVLQVISVERARVALQHGSIRKAFDHIISNKVNILVLIRYGFYMIKRMITRETYGFFI